jgi:chromosome segregation ATPase
VISDMMRDYEQQIEDLTQRLNDACVDLVETRSQLAGRRKLYEALIDRHAEVTGQASRYRLAWRSARRRARRHDALADELDERLTAERDEARAEVVRLGKALEDENRGRYADLKSLLDRIKEIEGERDDARALVDGLAAGSDRLRAALAEERIEPERCVACVRGCPPGPCPAGERIEGEST